MKLEISLLLCYFVELSCIHGMQQPKILSHIRRFDICAELQESLLQKVSLNRRSFANMHLRGGGNRGRGSVARRRQNRALVKAQLKEQEQSDSGSQSDNRTDCEVKFEIPPPAQPEEDDGSFAALDRLLDNPIVERFAEQLFADKSFQVFGRPLASAIHLTLCSKSGLACAKPLTSDQRWST